MLLQYNPEFYSKILTDVEFSTSVLVFFYAFFAYCLRFFEAALIFFIVSFVMI